MNKKLVLTTALLLSISTLSFSQSIENTKSNINVKNDKTSTELNNPNAKHQHESAKQDETNYIINKRANLVSDSFNRKQIYETKYFKIFYDKNSIDAVRELVRVADKMAETEANLFKMNLPKNKIPVYLLDNKDQLDSFSSGSGIHLMINNTSVVTLEFKNWIPYVFSHELTHELIDHKLTESGINKYIPLSGTKIQRYTIPSWWTEGMAVTVESMMSKGGGRTFDPEFVAIAKADLNDGQFKGIGHSLKNRPYEYGNSFCRFYLETYGIEKFSEALDYYSKHKLGGVGRAYAHVAGLKADELHDKWIDFLYNKINDVKGRLVEGATIYDKHVANMYNIKDESNIYTYKIEKNEQASTISGHFSPSAKLVKIPIKKNGKADYDSSKEFYVPLATNGTPAIKGHTLYYSDMAASSLNGTFYSTSYKYDLLTGEKNILKGIKRAGSFANIGGNIYYLYNGNGVQGISRLDNQTILKAKKYAIKSISDDGNGNILMVAHVEGKGEPGIYRIDLKTNNIKFLANGKSAALDKNILYFSDNFGSETNNIYKKDLNNNKVTRLTNVLYDAKNPEIVNGNLVYLNYVSKDSDISAYSNYSTVSLKLDDTLNETKNLAELEKNRQNRYTINTKLYGNYIKNYKENSHYNVTRKELEENNKLNTKDYFFPSLITNAAISNDLLRYEIATPEFRTDMQFSYYLNSYSSGLIDGNAYRDADDKTLYDLPRNSGHRQDKYRITYSHKLSMFSQTSFTYIHESTHLRGNLDISEQYGTKRDTQRDVLMLVSPFRIESLDETFIAAVVADGDLLEGGKTEDKLIGNNLKLIGVFGKNTIGFVANSGKGRYGNAKHSYMYFDRDIKGDLPYISKFKPLSTLHAKLYLAPQRMTSAEGSSSQLTSEETGFSDKGGCVSEVDTYINNARLAGTLYGDFKHIFEIQKGTDFGMIYLDNITARLGFEYTAYEDEDYKNSDQYFELAKDTLGDPSLKRVSFSQAKKMYADLNSEREINYNRLASTSEFNKARQKELIRYKKMNPKMNSAEANSALDFSLKKIYSTPELNDPQFVKTERARIENELKKTPQGRKELADFEKREEKLDKKGLGIASLILSTNEDKGREKKLRQGIAINPEISMQGTLYNSAADFKFAIGNTFIGDYTSKKFRDDDISYLSVEFLF